MNIAITLPSDLLNAIADGKKKYEVRKVLPKNFDPRKDVVFVVQKGTNKVVGYMVWDYPIFGNCFNDFWEHYGAGLAVSKAFFVHYLENAACCVLWRIMSFHKFTRPMHIVDLGISKSPQSYVYTRYKLEYVNTPTATQSCNLCRNIWHTPDETPQTDEYCKIIYDFGCGKVDVLFNKSEVDWSRVKRWTYYDW